MNTAVIKPWSAQVELTAGCQLRCPFCGINALPWDRQHYEYMELANVFRVAAQIKSLNHKPRIEFALRGEPLKHPAIDRCIAAFRRILPQAQLLVVSNGVELLNQDSRHFVTDLYRAGLNTLLLDCYRPYGDKLKDKVRSWGIAAVHHEIGDGFWPWLNHGPEGRHIVFSPDLRDTSDRGIMNHAGNSPAKPRTERPLQKTCPNPWREVVVQVTGDVPICCMDFGCEYRIGNVFERSLSELWVSREAQAARKMLRHSRRWFTPCCRCDGPSPGRNRAIALCEEPTQGDMLLIQKVNQGSPCLNGFEPEWWGPNE